MTIGAYDGVHLGHRRVIEAVCSTARSERLESIVVTFDRHPASVVRPESAPLQLTDLAQRLELLRATGVDDVVVIEFTPARAAESAEDFVDEVLVGRLAARIVIVGSDFHFGRGRRGDVSLLEKMGQERGFQVRPFELVEGPGDTVVSSTRIRELISSGDLRRAAALLGRDHEVRGTVAGEVSAFSGAGEGGAGVHLEVPPFILLPPPGGYRCRCGPVGGTDGVEGCHVVVPPGHGALAVLGLRAPWPEGTTVRLSFKEQAATGE